MKKLRLNKIKITQLDNLSKIRGGDDGDGPKKSGRPGCPDFTRPATVVGCG